MFGADNSQFTLIRKASAAAVVAALSACGGGGGGAATTPSEIGQSSGSNGETGSSGNTSGSASSGKAFVALDPIVSAASAFDAKVDATYSNDSALNSIVGGALYAAWNPNDPTTMLKPGMKIAFFGKAPGCSDLSGSGPVVRGSDADYAAASTRAGLPAADSQTRRWVPAAAASCDASVAGEDGPSMVQIDARDSTGAIGLYTHGGTTDAGGTAFLEPFDGSGRNGAGANANILGTFVSFRQPWSSASAIHPWNGAASARIATMQSVAQTAVGDAGTPSQYVQVKQQIAVTFINVQCAQSIISSTTPCQIQYLMNTDIERTGISDWSSVDWFNNAGIMFDPGQGGIPVVEGPIRARGEVTSDAVSGLALFQSQANPTQHAAFANVGFDVRIDFGQLINAARIVAGLKQQTAAASVSDSAMAALWGASWNDPSAWVLLTSQVGQEVYDPYADKKAYIGGSFSRLYVGAQN